MSVYVDSGKRPYGRMLMAHMLADSSAELLAMAEAIGVERRWLQNAGTYREHFDVCKSKRALAIARGAVVVSRSHLGRLLVQRRRSNWRPA